MPGYNVPLTKIIFAVLFGISDVNSDIFEGPWPYEKPTRNPELTLRCKWKPKIRQCEHNNLTFFGLLTGTTFKSESGLLKIYSLRYLYP